MKLLFVCLGNICRSPAAEGVMRSLVKARGLSDKIAIDSAGTSANHVGEPPDSRMQTHALKRDLNLADLRARQFIAADFSKFDLILVMDEYNKNNVQKLDPKAEFENKVVNITTYCKRHKQTLVPDPYYGGAQGFELVLDLLQDACENLLDELEKKCE